MLKDKLLHDRLGIPIQTLQNWKKSDGYTSLVYQYLINQEQEKFELDTQSVSEFYKYDLLTPDQFTKRIKDNWDKYNIFDGYELTTHIVGQDLGNAEYATLIANETKDSSKFLFVRFVYALSKQKSTFAKELDRLMNITKEQGIDEPKIIYVTSSINEPKYFSELEHDVSIIHYRTFHKELSGNKLIII